MTACGSLTMMTTSSVTYTAPATVPTPAMVMLTATSVFNPAKSNTATITVTAAAAAALAVESPAARQKPADFQPAGQKSPLDRGMNTPPAILPHSLYLS